MGRVQNFFVQFRFDRRWNSKRGFKEIVAYGWSVSRCEEDIDLIAKIRSCRRAMAKWKHTSNVNSEKLIHELKWKSDKCSHQTQLDKKEFHELKRQLYHAYKEEETYWKLKSRNKWMREGDRNTKFFHSYAKQRRVSNKIQFLIDEEINREKFSEEEMGETAINHFTMLYRSELCPTLHEEESFIYRGDKYTK